jgi:hypothetical protein
MVAFIPRAVMLISLLASATSTLGHPSPQPSGSLSWTITPTNSTQQFRGLAPVSEKIAWVSGTAGTVLRTTNSGLTWTNVSPTLIPENATTFEFRDIQAHSLNWHRERISYPSHARWRSKLETDFHQPRTHCLLRLHGVRKRETWHGYE